MQVFVGTSGYAYKEWKGSFYPDKLPAAGMLRFYAEHFRTVEINNTFYRMPAASVLKGWAEDVPEGFIFVLKAPRLITHIKRLQDAEDAVSYLLQTASVLGKRLGPVLFQLPPFQRKELPRLDGFLQQVSKGFRAAFEFRHDSWFDEEVYSILRSHNAALCVADADDKLTVPFVSTADWGYLRLRREAYDDQTLRDWANRITQQKWNNAFVFFKHEEAGTGPKLAARLISLLDKHARG